MPSILESRQRSAASDLRAIVTEIENYLGRDDADTESSDYVALRESREAAEATLADITANLNARRLAETPAAAEVNGERISEFRQVLREYDRGMSRKFSVPYSVLRETTTANVFSQTSRIEVPTIPVVTPTLDAVTSVPSNQTYDFVVPPPPVAASTVAEGAPKPTLPYLPTRVDGSLATDAAIVDATRQSIEDDASGEATIRAWLEAAVRLRQDAKAAAAIAGATGTLTASSTTMLNSIRKGKAELSKVGIVATTVSMHPDDAMNADIEAMTNAHTGPESQATLWNMRVIENPGITVGTAIVGSLAQAVYLLYRSAIQTYITDSGMTKEATPRDRFEHNILGFLGEGRSNAHVVQPGLLCKCTVSP